MKMTKREMFESLKAKYDLTDKEKAFIDHELELLAKKNSGERKPTAQQTANAAIKDEVKAILADGTARTVGEILKALDKGDALTHSRLTAIVTQMVKDEVVKREEIKRKAYFSLA